MKAVGVIGPDFEPRLFDVDEPIPARDGVVVEVMASSVNEFDWAAARGHHARQEDRLVPAVVAPNGHKLADLLFKVAAQRLRSHVDATVSFDQVWRCG
jgi:D-arabinose 1-dehydrogenase-like Zn-dependent alcohol dehydrogenase